jgi:plasmid stabilization system protein ParE
MKRVFLSPLAAEFIRSEARYLKSRNQRAALNFLDEIKRVKRQLSMFPESGPANDFPGFTGTRKIVMGHYIVMYDADADVRLLLIRHGQQIDTLMTPDDPDPEA